MAFNIREMLGAINSSGGLTKSSKFFVEITPPRSFPVTYNLFFLCEASALPGVAYASDEVRMTGYGNVEKRPYAPMFQDLNLLFLNDSNGSVLKFFHRWAQAVFNFNLDMNPEATSRPGLPKNTVGYPDDYCGIINIYHYDDAGDQVIMYTINQAYPIAIGDIGVDWNNSDQLVRVPVSMAYSYWTSETLDQGIIDNKTRAVYNAVQGTATRVDLENKVIWNLLNFTDPAITQNRVNIFAGALQFI